MKTARPARLIPLLTLAAMIGAGGVALAAENQAEARSQLQQLKGEIDKLKANLQQFRNERSRVQGDLRKSELEISKTQRKIREIEQQLQGQERELQQLQQQRDGLLQSRRNQQDHIARQVRAAWQMGQQNKLKALLNQEDPERVSRTLTYYDYFNRARSEQIEAYLDLLAQIDAMQPEIEKKAAELKSIKSELDAQHSQKLSARQERERALAKLAKTIKSKDEELKQMAQDRAALEQLLRKLEKIAARKRDEQRRQAVRRDTPTKPGAQLPAVTSTDPIVGDHRFGELRGRLPWPVAGRPANRFGAKRGDSQLRWQGINIIAREGDTVRAVHGGRVIFADWLRGSGLLLIIDHGGGFMSLYAHNQTLLRNVGDAIKAGDPIATVGNSGGQQQAALYFEIRRAGVPTDPAQWCRRS
jgi:septal ring factor EnvC (AmiA/AmiB activator)